jgi:hypothetical protein
VISAPGHGVPRFLLRTCYAAGVAGSGSSPLSTADGTVAPNHALVRVRPGEKSSSRTLPIGRSCRHSPSPCSPLSGGTTSTRSTWGRWLRSCRTEGGETDLEHAHQMTGRAVTCRWLSQFGRVLASKVNDLSPGFLSVADRRRAVFAYTRLSASVALAISSASSVRCRASTASER